MNGTYLPKAVRSNMRYIEDRTVRKKRRTRATFVVLATSALLSGCIFTGSANGSGSSAEVEAELTLLLQDPLLQHVEGGFARTSEETVAECHESSGSFYGLYSLARYERVFEDPDNEAGEAFAAVLDGYILVGEANGWYVVDRSSDEIHFENDHGQLARVFASIFGERVAIDVSASIADEECRES